jgi:hypothetical protein
MIKVGLTILLIVLGSIAYSQDQADKTKKTTTSIGFQIGLTTTDMNGENIELEIDNPGAKYEKGKGVEVAFRIKHEFNNLIYFKSGLGYYQRDGQVVGSRMINATHGPFNFLQIPFLFGIQPINVNNSGGLNLGFESGISLNNLVSSDDNLEKGLHPDNEVERKSFIPSWNLGLNLEIPINNSLIFTANYQYVKDLTYYFNRRYSWYSSQLERETYKDYDLWFKSSSVSVGLLFRVD